MAGASPGEPSEGLYLLDPSGAAPKLIVRGEEDDPSWSPDGRWTVALDTNDFKFNVTDSVRNVRHRVDSLAWSHTGSRVAYTVKGHGGTSRLFVASSNWSKPRLVTTKKESAPLAWSPDDRHFVYGSARASCCWSSLVVVEANGTHARRVLKNHGVVSVSWSPSGRLLAVMDYDSHVYLVASAGGPVRQLPGSWDGWPTPEWSPDSKALYIYPASPISDTGGFDAVRLDIGGGQRTVVCQDCARFSFSADRRWIAFVDSSASLWVEKADGSGKKHIADDVYDSRWSADSRHLVVTVVKSLDPDTFSTIVALADSTTGQVRPLTDGTHIDLALGVSTDGGYVAFNRYGDGVGHQLWIVRSDGTGTRKVFAFGTCSLVSWSPKRSQLAVTNLDDC